MIAALALLAVLIAQQAWRAIDASRNWLKYGDEMGAAIVSGNAALRASGLLAVWLVLAAVHWL